MVRQVLNLGFLLSMVLVSLSWAAKSKIELVEDREMSGAELRQKIRALQENVIDLEMRVQKLEAKPEQKMGMPPSNLSSSSNPEGKVTCFLETPFDGLFDATDVNETRARVEAVKACMGKVKSRIHCSTEKVKCGR
jgi:hypothetical protein